MATLPHPTPPPNAQPAAPTSDFQSSVLTALRLMYRELRQINAALTRLAESAPPPQPRPAPNLRRFLPDYVNFDWSQIGAEVTASDEDGPTMVRWEGQVYTRRTNPKFGAQIWFSRATGKDDAGEVTYERLITFDELPTVERLPSAVRKALG